MVFDVLVIGAGPAGLNAAVYSARYMLKTLVLGTLPGGLASEAYEICNLLSYEKISGFDLAQKMLSQVKSLGVEVKQENVRKISRKDGLFVVETDFDNTFSAKKIIFATGTKHRHLNLDKEESFLGRGVSYCATCDGAFFKGKVTAVVGGSDSALTAALLLSKFSPKVYIIYRRDNFFRAAPAWVKQVEETENIEPVFNSNVVELIGKDNLEAVKLDSGKVLEIDGLFVEIGSDPNAKLAEDLGVELDGKYIKTDELQRTNVHGFFAAGDVTNNHLKQIITAAAEGAIAANSAFEEIKKEG
ncbi:hypothetical protein DRJ25_01750 [Candidatus Woesearchaeota archaeon]|nr:MAG: hypothetical protein DRJ25_01750 [Candidatus Woesearchaeota archaeon]